MTPRLEITPVAGLPEIEEGADLATWISEATDVADGDVLVVCQKVVSKAEGAMVPAPEAADRAAARRRLARQQAVRVVAETSTVLVVETQHGFVCANAGIDESNVPRGQLTLLPADPDASARRIRAGVRERTGADVAVVVSDTFGRPWRTGQTDVAIGLAGMAGLRDERGGVDRQGRRLEVTEAAVADELAAAADLVRTKASGFPVVRVRGLPWTPDEGAAASDLLRQADQDLFRHGRGGLASSLGAGGEITDPVDAEDLSAAWRAAHALAPGPVTVVDLTRPHGSPTRIGVLADAPGAEPAAGVVAGVLLALLADQGYTTRLGDPRPDEPAVIVLEAGRSGRSGPGVGRSDPPG